MNLDTIKTELQKHLNDFIAENNNRKWARDISDLHHEAFNQDYYIIGYYQAEQWLKKHDISVFEGITFVQVYERDNFGDEVVRTYNNAEALVNMITYIIGEEVINSMGEDLIDKEIKL
jgi:hypothetical protein